VDLFIESLGDAAVKHGLNRQTAYKLISQMVSGTGKLQLESDKHPGVLKDEITSPGGTTIKGVSALEKNNFRGAIIEAVDNILTKP
jgi:pyrroline-5-carboxylate reductase